MSFLRMWTEPCPMWTRPAALAVVTNERDGSCSVDDRHDDVSTPVEVSRRVGGSPGASGRGDDDCPRPVDVSTSRLQTLS
jgi:hypothetical protein